MRRKVEEFTRLYTMCPERFRCGQVSRCRVLGTNVMQARYTLNHDKHCPSCGICKETCGNELTCGEAGRVDLLHQLIDLVDKGMKDHGTDPKLFEYLTKYNHG